MPVSRARAKADAIDAGLIAECAAAMDSCDRRAPTRLPPNAVITAGVREFVVFANVIGV